jgi:Type VI secretion system/phage-baseplate injector OB domain
MFQVKDNSTLEKKYVSRSKARVIDNVDPAKQGRIRVEHPLLGDTIWIPYLRTTGSFDPPSIGDIVYIEADCGYFTHPVAAGNLTKTNELPSRYQRSVPNNRGIFSPGGHFIELDDSSTTKAIRITTTGGIEVNLNDTDQKIIISDSGNNSIEIDTASGKLQININGDADINCNNANVIAQNTATVDGTLVKLGANAVESVIKGTSFATFFDAHVHTSTTPGNPTSPPTIPVLPNLLSTKVIVE